MEEEEIWLGNPGKIYPPQIKNQKIISIFSYKNRNLLQKMSREMTNNWAHKFQQTSYRMNIFQERQD